MQMLTASPNGVKPAEIEEKRDPITGLAYPSKPFMKVVYKTPIVLWRLGLGPLIGRTFLILTTNGRKSGKPRRTAVEYIMHNGRKYVLSGWGVHAQWYKNIESDPHVTIQTAHGTEHVIARRVTDEAELNDAYTAVENSRVMQEVLEGLDVKITREQFVHDTDNIYVLTFDLTDQPTPPPLKPDLTWVWSVIGNVVIGLVIARAVRRRKQRKLA